MVDPRISIDKRKLKKKKRKLQLLNYLYSLPQRTVYSGHDSKIYTYARRVSSPEIRPSNEFISYYEIYLRLTARVATYLTALELFRDHVMLSEK